MVNNLDPIKEYMSSYIDNEDIIFNIRGIVRSKDLRKRISTAINLKDIDIVDFLIHNYRKLDNNLLEQYFQIFPDIRFYFNPCPISKKALSDYKINSNCFTFIPSVILNSPLIFPIEYSGVLLDIDDMEDYEPVISILKKENIYNNIVLDIPSVIGKHVYIKGIGYNTVSKLKSQTENLRVTYKTHRNFVLLKSLMSS